MPTGISAHYYASDTTWKEALLQFASIDLIELCKEAKVEHCRASRDLSTCGRYVQHALSSCGHAALCEECSQRCDVCPICRTPLPKGGKLRLRLYDKCIEAGIIARKDDARSEQNYNGEHLDVQRLYSLFDVALENNLVSSICHYVTDVCLDENAVSSDPVLAFLLDEVVVKNWCRWKYKSVVQDLHDIYVREEGMQTNLNLLLKFSSRLNGISNVLAVLESSFAGSLSAELQDLHWLSENTLKTKQVKFL
ncbi:unnamed protein product [Spirodela intermedia]|uniref:RING-type domain-containing protein n=1 Tax=Spirodela intermedia TaxID=51605 RepID=A0A7I8LKB0_SPIIN|nr:unnamed protein product [Spirodela intermedia]